MSPIAVAAVVVWFLTALSAGAAQPSGPTQLITGVDLRSALAGHILIWADQAGRPGHLYEVFRQEDGQWEMMGTRAPLFGSYRIEFDRFCVSQAPGTRRCRQLYRDPLGRYFTRAVQPAGKRTEFPPNPVILQSAPGR